jgi:hypothetical protein
MDVMIRMQVQLTEEQLEKVRRVAEREETSVSDVVRKAVDALAAAAATPAELRARALAATGRFGSGDRDGAANHDRHLAAAFLDSDSRSARSRPERATRRRS